MANGTSSTRGSQPNTKSQQPQNAQPAPTPAPPRQRVKPPIPNNMQSFANLTTSQQAAAINSALSTTLPDVLNNKSDLQKLLVSQNLTGVPTVVSPNQLSKTRGTTIYRTVNAIYDSNTDTGYTAPQIADQTLRSRHVRTSDGGTAVYGEGLYFATRLSSSLAYGKTRGDISKTCYMTAKISPSAKIITYNQAVRGADSEIRRGTQLGKALKLCSDPYSVYAVCKGYQAIDNQRGYINIIDRSCLTISDQYAAK